MPRQNVMPNPSWRGEVVIYSSSHFSETRGLRKLLIKLVGDQVKFTIHARGGRTWDRDFITQFKRSQQPEQSGNKLHIILLGDNDLRRDVRNGIDPRARIDILDDFAKVLKDISRLAENKGDIIIVEGLVPFPMENRPDSEELTKHIKHWTHSMSALTTHYENLYFSPLRQIFIDYCDRSKVSLNYLFRRDWVHLSEKGEHCLAQHVSKQISYYIDRLKGCEPLTSEGQNGIDGEYFGQLISKRRGNRLEQRFEICTEFEFDSYPPRYYSACRQRHEKMLGYVADRKLTRKDRLKKKKSVSCVSTQKSISS